MSPSRRASQRVLRGSMTALVTPFSKDGEVDVACLDRLIDRQVAGGTDWLVALGTTAETPTLTDTEQDRIIQAVIARVDGRRPVMIGTGTNDTASTVRSTKRAVQAGADAVLVVAPYYSRPSQEGLFQHFMRVAEASEVPVVLYNVPARTGVCLENDLVVRLREAAPNIVAIKDATGNVDRVTDIRSRCDVVVLCGDDSLTWPFMALGAVGVVSVLANLCPSVLKRLVSAALDFDPVAALKAHGKVYDLATSLGRFGPNPIPIKTAMAIAGLIEEEFRLPLHPLSSKARGEMTDLLRRHEMVAT